MFNNSVDFDFKNYIKLAAKNLIDIPEKGEQEAISSNYNTFDKIDEGWAGFHLNISVRMDETGDAVLDEYV